MQAKCLNQFKECKKAFRERKCVKNLQTRRKKMKIIKIIAITMIFLSLNFNLYGFIVFNGGGSGFCTDCEGNKTNNLNQLIILAAGHFLQSNSDYQIVLKRIELSETGLNDALNQAIQNMSMANALYFDICETSKALEYDPIVIEKLYQFHFSGYQIENNLNPVIFQQVEDLLKPGLVRELFKKAFEDSSKILEKLKDIQTSLESGKKVDISDYWRLNQLYLEFAFFGQYASEVFVNLEEVP
jgi:hypothetical protein